MQRPRLLLLDEPHQGVDWETYQRFWELVKELRKDGRAVLVISHLYFEQQRFDVLYRLQEGQVHIQAMADLHRQRLSSRKEQSHARDTHASVPDPAIAARNTIYLTEAFATLRRRGEEILETTITHVAPLAGSISIS